VAVSGAPRRDEEGQPRLSGAAEADRREGAQGQEGRHSGRRDHECGSGSLWRASGRHPLGDTDKGRNRRIGSKRLCIERTFAVIKRVFGAERVVVTSLPRVRVKLFFSCLCFDLLQLETLGVA
jgi:IS5 family transposase